MPGTLASTYLGVSAAICSFAQPIQRRRASVCKRSMEQAAASSIQTWHPRHRRLAKPGCLGHPAYCEDVAKTRQHRIAEPNGANSPDRLRRVWIAHMRSCPERYHCGHSFQGIGCYDWTGHLEESPQDLARHCCGTGHGAAVGDCQASGKYAVGRKLPIWYCGFDAADGTTIKHQRQRGIGMGWHVLSSHATELLASEGQTFPTPYCLGRPRRILRAERLLYGL